MSFDDWLIALSNLGRLEGCADYVDQTGTECWVQYFEEGLTPDQAWEQEKDAAYALGCV